MGPIPGVLDFLVGLLQGIAFAFLVYGAYLAIRRLSVRPVLSEPFQGATAREKGIALEGGMPDGRERRSHIRRKSDRRAGPYDEPYGLAR